MFEHFVTQSQPIKKQSQHGYFVVFETKLQKQNRIFDNPSLNEQQTKRTSLTITKRRQTKPSHHPIVFRDLNRDRNTA